MTKILLDNNFLIYSLDPKAPQYERAVELIAEFNVQNIACIITPYIINELHYFYLKMYHFGKSQEIVYTVLKNPVFEVIDLKLSKDSLVKIIKLATKYNLKTFDAYHAYYCKNLGIKKIATFDSDFERVPFLKVVN